MTWQQLIRPNKTSPYCAVTWTVTLIVLSRKKGRKKEICYIGIDIKNLCHNAKIRIMSMFQTKTARNYREKVKKIGNHNFWSVY